MEFSRCPSPAEIEWTNIARPSAEKNGKKRISYLYFGLLFGVFMLVHLLFQLMLGRKIGKSSKFIPNMSAAIVGISLLSLTQTWLLPFLIDFIQK